MADENITDIVNQLVDDTASEEIVQEEVDIKPARQAEAQSRNQAMQDIKRDQSAAFVNEARKQTQSYKKQIEELKKEVEGLKSGLGERDKKLNAIEKNVSTHSDRMLTDDVIAKENLLMKHPKYGKWFNRDEVRQHYINAAKNESRYFDPEESMKLLAFDKLAEKLEQYEKANEFRKSLYEGTFSRSNAPTDEDGLSDVKDPDAAEAWMRKKAGVLGL